MDMKKDIAAGAPGLNVKRQIDTCLISESTFQQANGDIVTLVSKDKVCNKVNPVPKPSQLLAKTSELTGFKYSTSFSSMNNGIFET